MLLGRLPVTPPGRERVSVSSWSWDTGKVTLDRESEDVPSPSIVGLGVREPEGRGADRLWRVTNGADRDRTGDPLDANQVLSQLSYRPLQLHAQDNRPSGQRGDQWA